MTRTIRPADRAHRIATIDAERAALRRELAAAYEARREAETDAEIEAADAEVDRLVEALGVLVGERDGLATAA